MTAQLPISTAMQSALLTAQDYWTLADSGAFQGFVKTELIEGELFVVNAVHTRHARAHAAITIELGIALRQSQSNLTVYSTPSTALSDDSVPEPDIALAESADGKALPATLVKLAIEISDSTLSFDLGRKAKLYARHGIPEYWVFDVEGKKIQQHWQPGDAGYVQRQTLGFGDDLSAKTIAGLTINMSSLLS
jgi:Uma2 family endonuclease